jgi:hypothetical protein
MKNKLLTPPEGVKSLETFNWSSVVARYLNSDHKTVHDIPALDLAQALGAMIFIHGLPPMEAAGKFGKDRSWMMDRLKILHFSPSVQYHFSGESPDRLCTDDARLIFKDPPKDIFLTPGISSLTVPFLIRARFFYWCISQFLLQI